MVVANVYGYYVCSERKRIERFKFDPNTNLPDFKRSLVISFLKISSLYDSNEELQNSPTKFKNP